MDETPPERAETAFTARHGFAEPRGQAPLPGSRGGRFGRMFGALPVRDPGTKALEALIKQMHERSASVSAVDPDVEPPPLDDLGLGLVDPAVLELAPAPEAAAKELPYEYPAAGYTYLGQFVDHDITFDPASRLGHDNDPRALVNFRTPRFDLDSLYGSGPQDQPFLYDWQRSPRGVKLLVGHNWQDLSLEPEERDAEVDLPRNQQGRALIGDARNDENLIVSQLHLVFVKFHNEVVDHICETEGHPRGTALFEEARRVVRWHYQWVVVHDFLEQFVGRAMAREVLNDRDEGQPPRIQRTFFRWHGEPYVPVEFSGAAFRCGHSMVRDNYQLTVAGPDSIPILHVPDSKEPRHLGGFRRLPAGLVIDWEMFFRTTATQPLTRLLLDPSLTRELLHLPRRGGSLVRLNLERGRALGLPAGVDVANALGYPPLDQDELELGPMTSLIEERSRQALLRATPLWYYVLCEAWARGHHGIHLGEVGGRIVAEVLVGLLEGDPQSYVRQWPNWKPTLPTRSSKPEKFDMADLVRFATGVKDPPAVTP